MKTFLLLIIALAALHTARAAPDDARALFDSARAKFTQAGALAQQGKFGPANELIKDASAGMDRAVAMAPEDIELRARRGLLFNRMSFLPGRAEQSAQDLRWVRDHPRFQELPESMRTSVTQALSGEHLDRLPQVPSTTSPVIAAMSFTAPSRPGAVPDWIEWTTRAIRDYPGLLGTHAVASVDHPGMYILFTWWTDKAALNSFFHSDMHQSWMRRRGATMAAPDSTLDSTPDSKPGDASMPTQTAAEIMAGFPVPGARINGGFVPQEVVDRFSPSRKQQ